MQLLSEPSGGSDMAGALTRLTRDGDTYVLNGSKMWSSGATQADYGLCLARTDWDAPKHRGLSMIAVPLQGTPGLTIEPIRAVTGVDGHFCQEFFDDVVLPAENLVGEENQGWAVAQTPPVPRAPRHRRRGSRRTASVSAGAARWASRGRGDRRAHRRRLDPARRRRTRRYPPADRRLVHRAHRVAVRERAGDDRPAHRSLQGPVGLAAQVAPRCRQPAAGQDRPRGRTAPTA